MNPLDIVLILLLLVIVFFALRRTIRIKKSGVCGCGRPDCEGCAGAASCSQTKKTDK